MYNYFNFNGVQVNDLALVTKIEKPYIPERTINTINVTSRDGQIFDGMKYNAIKIPISLAIIGNDEEDYELRVKILKDTFKVRNEVPIGFADNTSIYGMLSSDFKVQKKNAVTGYADIEIICNNPYTYSDHTLTFEAEEGHKEVTVEQNGGVDALPLVSIGFTKQAHFAQIENMTTGERVLVGDYPKLELSSTKEESKVILRDPCESLSGLTIGGANIDANRSTNGSFGISTSGNSYMLSSMGDGGTTYKGACGRIALSSSVDQFKLRVKLQHNSQGKNGDPNKYDPEVEKHKEEVKSGSKTPYYVVNCTGLNYRTGPGTNYTSKGTLPKGLKITEYTIQNGWCKFKYKTKTYYCSAKYLTKMIDDNTKSEWKTFTIENVWVMPPSGNKTDAKRAVFSKANSSSKIVGYIPYGSKIRVLLKPENQKDKDGKVIRTFYKMWKPYTDSKGNKIKGYIDKEAIKRAFDMDANSVKYEDDPGYADDKLGTVEVYGFNTNGNQLFKLCMFDDNPYFEYTQPQVRIGNRVVLKDTSKTPTPKPKTEASQNQTTVSYYLGGKHGDWNEYIGWFTLTRKKVGNQYVWDVEVTKEKNGNIVNRQASKNLKYTDLPTDELSYLAIYIGTNAASMNKCSAMAVSHIEVQSLNPKTSTDTSQNVTYFKAGDILDLDFENSNCYLNRELRNDLVDIGSTYFSIDPGETEIVVNSDDTNASLSVAVKEKWVGVVDEDIATTPKYD